MGHRACNPVNVYQKQQWAQHWSLGKTRHNRKYVRSLELVRQIVMYPYLSRKVGTWRQQSLWSNGVKCFAHINVVQIFFTRVHCIVTVMCIGVGGGRGGAVAPKIQGVGAMIAHSHDGDTANPFIWSRILTNRYHFGTVAAHPALLVTMVTIFICLMHATASHTRFYISTIQVTCTMSA